MDFIRIFRKLYKIRNCKNIISSERRTFILLMSGGLLFLVFQNCSQFTNLERNFDIQDSEQLVSQIGFFDDGTGFIK